MLRFINGENVYTAAEVNSVTDNIVSDIGDIGNIPIDPDNGVFIHGNNVADAISKVQVEGVYDTGARANIGNILNLNTDFNTDTVSAINAVIANTADSFNAVNNVIGNIQELNTDIYNRGSIVDAVNFVYEESVGMNAAAFGYTNDMANTINANLTQNFTNTVSLEAGYYNKSQIDNMFINNANIDLSDYYNKAEVNNITDVINTDLSDNYYNKVSVDAINTDLSDNYYNKAEVDTKIISGTFDDVYMDMSALGITTFIGVNHNFSNESIHSRYFMSGYQQYTPTGKRYGISYATASVSEGGETRELVFQFISTETNKLHLTSNLYSYEETLSFDMPTNIMSQAMIFANDDIKDHSVNIESIGLFDHLLTLSNCNITLDMLDVDPDTIAMYEEFYNIHFGSEHDSDISINRNCFKNIGYFVANMNVKNWPTSNGKYIPETNITVDLPSAYQDISFNFAHNYYGNMTNNVHININASSYANYKFNNCFANCTIGINCPNNEYILIQDTGKGYEEVNISMSNTCGINMYINEVGIIPSAADAINIDLKISADDLITNSEYGNKYAANVYINTSGSYDSDNSHVQLNICNCNFVIDSNLINSAAFQFVASSCHICTSDNNFMSDNLDSFGTGYIFANKVTVDVNIFDVNLTFITEGSSRIPAMFMLGPNIGDWPMMNVANLQYINVRCDGQHAIKNVAIAINSETNRQYMYGIFAFNAPNLRYAELNYTNVENIRHYYLYNQYGFNLMPDAYRIKLDTCPNLESVLVTLPNIDATYTNPSPNQQTPPINIDKLFFNWFSNCPNLKDIYVRPGTFDTFNVTNVFNNGLTGVSFANDNIHIV